MIKLEDQEMEIYVEILTKIKIAAMDDDVNSCKVLCALVNYVNKSLNSEVTKKCQQNTYMSLGNIHLICLSCKLASVKVLQHLLSDEGSICSLPYLAKKSDLLPEEEDEDCHNAMYYAIRSNMTGVPEILIDKWLSDYFKGNLDKLDDLISKAFKDLTIRNVFISEDMRAYIKSKLVDLRFFNKTSSQKKSTGSPSDTKNLKDLTILRIDFVLKSITCLRKRFWNKEPNEQFLLSSKFIAKNIHMLESSVTFKDRLPWKEINFCLIIFIRSCQGCFQQYPLYHFVFNKHKLLKHLKKFSQILNKLKDKIKTAKVNKFGKLLIGKIDGIENIVDFKRLYDDFTQIRDLYSLEKIKSCIDLAMSANIIEKCDQLVIVRALQIIGECMKSTVDSPNLSEDTYKLLISSLPDNMKEIVNKLRDSLSHEESLSMRSRIEMSEQNFFKRIQSDICEMNFAITDIIRRKKTTVIGKLLSKIRNFKDIDTMKLFLKHNQISAISLQKELLEAQNLNLGSIEKLENLVLELEREVKNQINDAMKLFLRIQDIVQSTCVEYTSNESYSFECFKSYIPVDPMELLKIYSDFCSVTSVSLQTKIESTNQAIGLKTRFNMPKNIEKYREILIKIHKKYGLLTMLCFLKKMNNFLDYSDIPQCISELQRGLEAIPIKVEEIKQFERLIMNLKNDCDQKATRAEEMFQKVHSLIQSEKINSKHTQNTFRDYLRKLITIIQFDNEECSHALETPMLDFQEAFETLTLSSLSKKFSSAFQNITSELVRDNFARGINFLTALAKIHMFLEFRLGKIKWIKEFKQMLESHKKQKPLKYPKKGHELNDQMEYLLPSKLSLLEKIINDYHATKLFFEKSRCSQKKLKLLSVIEMIMLDLMTILGCLPNRLTHNAFFLDSDYPVVNSRNLRNHLAHGNALVNIVLGYGSTDVLLNGEKMIKHDLLKSDRQIGKRVKNDPQKLKISLDKDLSAVNVQSEFFAALTAGNMGKVKYFISKGADMFGKDLRSQTSLHFSAKGSSLEIVKFVLTFNLDVSAVDINFQTALHVASFNGRLPIVEFLIDELNASVYKRDVNGKAPLHLASINGHTDIVKCLLKHGAEIACKDIFGNTALHYAVIQSHIDIVNILLGKETSTDVNKTFFGVSALHLASEVGHESLVTTLLEKIDVNFKSSSHFVPLHYAARGGHADVAQFLINKGAEINARNLHGNTPLHIAAEKGHDAVVAILLQYGADINAANLNGLTALSFAARGGFTTASKLLLKKGMVVDDVKNSFWTSLNLAAKIGSYFLVKSKLLLGKTVTVDRINGSLYCPIILAAKFGHHELVEMLFHKCDTSSKISALHWAALKGHLSIVQLLVNNGINVECEDNGFTALHLAACEGHTDVVNFLISKGYIKKVNSKISREELEGNLSHGVQDSSRIAILFISGGTNFDDVSQFSGTTALHLSAFRKHKDIVRSLLKIQADIYIKDDIGSTPLEIMISNGMAYILVEECISINFAGCGDSGPLQLGAAQGDLLFVKYCIQKGCDKDASYKLFIPLFSFLFKSNTLDLDAKNKALAVAVYFGHEEIVNYLIDSEANVNAESPDGFTPLDLAVEAKRKKIVSILIDDKKAEISSEKERKYVLSAIRSGHEDLVEYFLTRNPANSTSRPECSEFPLHTAVQYGHLNIVKKLLELEKRDDINDENENAATPLQLASGQGYCEITRLLLSKGADPNRPDHFPPLLLAVTNGDREMIEIVIKAGANITQRDAEGYSPIESAIKCKSLDIMETLLEISKLDINLKGPNGQTLLHHAAVSGSLEIFKRLIEKGAAINCKDSTGAKPIHIAAREGHQDIVEYFLTEGLDIDDRGENGWSLLHYTAAGNQSEICKFFLKNCLNVNVVDAHGCTPLHVAAQMGNADVLHILLHYGAFYDFRNERNETPLDVAMTSIFEPTSKFPIVASLAFISSLFSAVEKNDLSKVKASLNEGLKFSEFGYANVKNAKNISPLFYAAEEGYEEIVDLLLKYNADPNETPANGSITLDYGAKFSHPRIVDAPIRSDTMFNAQCNSKKSNFATDRDIIELSNLLKIKLSAIQNGENLTSANSNTLGNLGTGKAVMKSRNSCGGTLTALAVMNDHSEAKSVKFLFQPDVNIRYQRANRLYEKGQFEESLHYYKIILQKRIAIFGEIDPGVLDIQEIVCEILINQEKYDEAEKLTGRFYNIRKEILGDWHKDTLRAMRVLASVLGYKGRKKEALKMLEGVFKKQKAVLGSDHAETLRTQIDIIELMCEEETESASLTKALNTCLETVKKLDKFQVFTHFILQLKVKIAQQLFNLGSPSEALHVFKDVFEIQKEIFGLYHSQTSDTLFQTARTLFDMGEEEDSLKAFRETLDIRHRVLGPDNERTLDSRYWVANALYSQRMFHEAFEFYKADLEARTVILGANHPDILETQEKIDFILSQVIS
ncbi:Ankyrin-3 [Araneus ventricosus]|uniref:Ankyrin-3 n=1 Tax=Araneus ventricosus TaxID=182803 RepID=A0A4Y2II68_ARAVE|nr:Ankyrin-3 [Araneus ventricosus]